MAKARRGTKKSVVAKRKKAARKGSTKRPALTNQAVCDAIAALKDRKGSSAKAVLAYLKSQDATKAVSPLQVKVALARGVKLRALIKSGASFKLRQVSIPKPKAKKVARLTRSRSRSRSRSSKSRSRSGSRSRSRSRSKSPGRKSVKTVTKAKKAVNQELKKVTKKRKARRGKAAAKRRTPKRSKKVARKVNKKAAAPRKIRRRRRRSARKWMNF